MPNLYDDVGRQEGVAADCKKVVVKADRLSAEGVRQNSGEALLQGALRPLSTAWGRVSPKADRSILPLQLRENSGRQINRVGTM